MELSPHIQCHPSGTRCILALLVLESSKPSSLHFSNKLREYLREVLVMHDVLRTMNVFGVALPLAVLAGFGFVGFRTYRYFSKG